MLFLISLFVAFLAFLIVMLGIAYVRRTRSTDMFYRLRRHNVVDLKKETETDDLLRRLYRFIKRTAKPLSKLNLAQMLDLRLKQAGVPLLGAEFIIIVMILSFLIAAIIYMFTLNQQLSMLAGLFTPIVLWFLLMVLINRRRNAFTEQLGDCLTTVSNALRAGYSFQQAVDVIAKEMEPPISEEFAHVAADIAMGLTLENALEQMSKRVDSSDFDLVVTAVLIQREVGGNLAQILDSISDTINERIRMKREILSLTAQGRFSALVLLSLPFVTGGIMYMINRSQFMMLFEEPIGRIAIAAAIVMEIIGYIVIQKIVDIDA